MTGDYCTPKSALFTDFYELTMSYGYWKQKMDHKVVFDMFYRRQPWNGGFAVFAGLDTLIDIIENFKFSESDIEYLRSLNYFEDGFLDYLKDFHFTGDLYAMDEGSVIFPNETLVRIHANMIEAQILEGLVLNQINFQSLIATKSARVWLASKRGAIMEFGLRRAQGPDGAMSASRAAFIGGAAGTSNTLAGKIYNIPVMGTMAHSWIMAFPTELEAFETYAKLYPNNAIFLIDTYDTLNSGIENAIKVGRTLVESGHNFGVRLDSGDIMYLSTECRKKLDKAGFPNATICVSNELTEEIVETLVQQQAPINSWGVGTHMVTGGNEASFTGVYKLAARSEVGSTVLKPTMKFSDNPEKATNPGVKNVFRIYDEDGMAKADVLALEDETISMETETHFYHPSIDYRQFSFKPSKIKQLLIKRLENGKRTENAPRLSQSVIIRTAHEKMVSDLETLDPSYKRILNPHIYKVSITEKLKDLKLQFINERIK